MLSHLKIAMFNSLCFQPWFRNSYNHTVSRRRAIASCWWLILEGVVGAVEGATGGFLAAKVVIGRASTVPYKIIDSNNNPSSKLEKFVNRCKRSIRNKRSPCLPNLPRDVLVKKAPIKRLKDGQSYYLKRFSDRHSLDDLTFEKFLRYLRVKK